MRSHRPISLVTAALLLPLLPGCRKEESAARPQAQSAPVVVQVAAAAQRPAPRTVEVTGTLYGDEEVTISAKVSGRVAKTLVDIGEAVAGGAALAEIERTDYEIAAEQAEAALSQSLSRLGLKGLPTGEVDLGAVPTVRQARLQAENAKARLARAEKLYRQQPPLISEQDYADAATAAAVADAVAEVALLAAQTNLAEVKSRQVDLRSKQQLLSDTVLSAPVPGGAKIDSPYKVTARLITAGDYVREGAPAFRLVRDNPIRFRASVPERYGQQVAVGQTCAVRVEGRKEAFGGSVRRINAQVDSASRAFQIEVELANPQGLLRAGSFARGALVVGQDEQGVFVPQAAVHTFAGIHKVFTVREGKIAEREVALGRSDADWVEIVKGVEAGAQVVVGGPARLASGVAVEVRTLPTTRPEGGR
jgi:RND family efflux transporter MFP subunit